MCFLNNIIDHIINGRFRKNIKNNPKLGDRLSLKRRTFRATLFLRNCSRTNILSTILKPYSILTSSYIAFQNLCSTPRRYVIRQPSQGGGVSFHSMSKLVKLKYLR